MLNSSFCREQRQKEQRRSQKILTIALVSSGVLHAILASAINGLYEPSKAANEPIELIIIEQPKTESIKSSPKPKAKIVSKSTLIPQPSKLPKTTNPVKSSSSLSTGQRQPIISPSTQYTSPIATSNIKLSNPVSPISVNASASPKPNNISQPSLEYSQGIEPLKAGLNNTSSAPLAVNDEPEKIINSPSSPTQLSSSSPVPIATSKQHQPILTSSNHNSSISVPDINVSNPITPVSANFSAPPKPNQISQPPLENSQGIESLKVGLTHTSSAPLTINDEPEKINHPTQLSPLASTSSPVPVATSKQRQPILTSSNPTPSISTANINLSNPITPISSHSSAPPKPKGISQPSSGNSQGTEQLKVGLTTASSAPLASFNREEQIISTSTPIATRTPQISKPQTQKEEVRCIRGCQPSYPAVLNGSEGSSVVQVLIDKNGSVTNAILVKANSNSQINHQALLKARNMKFTTPPNGERTSLKITINFTKAGSDFNRQVNEHRQQQRQERRTNERINKELRQQLELERQERREQQERQIQ